MKKFIALITIAALLNPIGSAITLADFADMKDDVETTLDIWVGGYLSETNNSVVEAFPDTYTSTLPEATGRVASNKAAEFKSLDSSPSGGLLFKDSHAPNRIHIELDFFNDEDWFGDLRYSFKDYFLLRVLPRRLRHNMENLTLYDFNPATSNSTEIEISDARVDSYGITMDIDEYRIRLKTPNFPLHVFSNGEIIRKKGTSQARFLGGNAYFFGGPRGGRVRVSESRDVDTEKKEFSLGANAHLGPVELEISHHNRQFESDTATPTYDYDFFATPLPHHSIPELEATTNTVRAHTSHSGRIFASTTYTEVEKSNESTTAEAEHKMGYGEFVWLPASYVSLTAKYRHLKNENTTPATVDAIGRLGANVTYTTHPGVKSTTETGSLAIRYSQIPSTNLKLSYTNKIKELDDESAYLRELALKKTTNTYEFGLTNWAIPKVRLSAKLRHTNVDHDFGADVFAYYNTLNGTSDSGSSNTPEDTNHANIGLTWMITPKIATLLSANITKEESDDLRFVGDSNHDNAEALRQQYLASMTFIVNEKLTITPSYTYIMDEQKRDLLWEDGAGTHYTDHDYSNSQEAHNVALNVHYDPIQQLSINTTVDYTATEGNYKPTSPFDIGFAFDAAEAAQFSNTKTQELNVRIDTDYDIGHGWAIGLDLQYTDWRDDSFDNPSDSEFYGGLVKLTKKIF